MRTLTIFSFLSFTLPVFPLSLTLISSETGPVPVGQMVKWRAESDGAEMRYRFRVRGVDGETLVIRDFAPGTDLDWTAWQREGVYEIEVIAVDRSTGEAATISAWIEMQSRATGDRPVVNATQHPLVMLLSAPGCAQPGRAWAEWQDSQGNRGRTPAQECVPEHSVNFYLAGLLASTDYVARVRTEGGAVSAPVSFRSGDAPELNYGLSVVKPPLAGATAPLVFMTSGQGQMVTDLAGQVVWYNPHPLNQITRLDWGGTFWGIQSGQDFPAYEPGDPEDRPVGHDAGRDQH